MRQLSVNKFRANLKKSIDQAISEHEPLRVVRRGGGDFVVIGAEDWERDQETIYVLQNSSLMEQIAESLRTHIAGTGYRPTEKELDEIHRF